MKRVASFVLCTAILLGFSAAQAAEVIIPQLDFPQDYQSWPVHAATPCSDASKEKTFTLSDFGTVIPANEELRIVQMVQFNGKLVIYEYQQGTKDALSTAFVYFPVTEGFAKLNLLDKKDEEKMADRIISGLGVSDAFVFATCLNFWSTEKEKFFDALQNELEKLQKGK